MRKAYRYLYDEQTGAYMGLTYDLPFPINSTDVEPHFVSHCKTVFDTTLNLWRLVDKEAFFLQMAKLDTLHDLDLEMIHELKHETKILRMKMDELNVMFDAKMSWIVKSENLNHKVIEAKINSIDTRIEIAFGFLNEDTKAINEALIDILTYLNRPNFIVRLGEVVFRFFLKLF